MNQISINWDFLSDKQTDPIHKIHGTHCFINASLRNRGKRNNICFPFLPFLMESTEISDPHKLLQHLRERYGIASQESISRIPSPISKTSSFQRIKSLQTITNTSNNNTIITKDIAVNASINVVSAYTQAEDIKLKNVGIQSIQTPPDFANKFSNTDQPAFKTTGTITEPDLLDSATNTIHVNTSDSSTQILLNVIDQSTQVQKTLKDSGNQTDETLLYFPKILCTDLDNFIDLHPPPNCHDEILDVLYSQLKIFLKKMKLTLLILVLLILNLKSLKGLYKIDIFR